MTWARRAILALALTAGIAPAFAQVPAPVPALPDAERRTSYSITASTCTCNVNFALFGDSNDYWSWLEVWINGVQVQYNDPVYGWTITSPSGPLVNLARPITNAVLTFNNAQTGVIQIVGARRPRRVSQFSENQGVSARNLNQALTDIVAQNRETWDKTNDMTGRGLFFAPGNATGPMPPPSACEGAYLAFDATGLNPKCVTVAGAPSGFTAGNGISIGGSNPATIGTTPIANNLIMSNISGAPTAAAGNTPTSIWDAFCSTTIGNFWVRQTGGWGCTALGYANPVWWGADPTGASDSAPAFNSAIATGLPIKWPSGVFNLNSANSVALPNAEASFVMSGSGNGATQLKWTAASGGLTVTAQNDRNTFSISDLSLYTSQASGGIALNFIGCACATPNAGRFFQSAIHNLRIAGDDFAQTVANAHYWTTAINIHNWGAIDIVNTNTFGLNQVPGSAGGGVGLEFGGDTPTGSYATTLNVSQSSFNYHGTGILLLDFWQGVTIDQCNFNGEVGNDAIQVSGSSGSQVLLTVTNSQIDTGGSPITIVNSGVLNATFIGNTITVSKTGAIGINSSATGSDGLLVQGNVFNANGSVTGTVGVSTAASHSIITGNYFVNLAAGVSLQSTSSGAVIALNNWSNVTTKVSPGGTGNSIGTASAGSMTGVVP